MIRALVDFALNNRFVVIALALLALGWGAISFHNLPVEAYPDIADNYVTDHHAVAGPGRRGSGAAGHDSDRNSDERNSASVASAVRVDFRSLLRAADLRRQLGQRLEPAEGAGADGASRSAAMAFRLPWARTGA